jgi:hypothetical protein
MKWIMMVMDIDMDMRHELWVGGGMVRLECIQEGWHIQAFWVGFLSSYFVCTYGSLLWLPNMISLGRLMNDKKSHLQIAIERS